MLEDWLSEDAVRLLRRFALSERALSAHALDEQRWFDFLLQAHRDGVDPTYSSWLERWFVEKARFPQESASSFVNKFVFALELLKAYDTSGGRRA